MLPTDKYVIDVPPIIKGFKAIVVQCFALQSVHKEDCITGCDIGAHRCASDLKIVLPVKVCFCEDELKEFQEVWSYAVHLWVPP
jgi:hypothetical protein